MFFIFTLLIFLFILSFLVLVHEFGHFIAAKKSGMLVEEFGIGYPPRLWSKKIGETVYSINALFFGGFVKLQDEETVPKKKSKRGYYAARPWTKTKLLLAGVAANLLVAVIIYYIILIAQGFTFYSASIGNRRMVFVDQQTFPLIQEIAKDSAASKSNLKALDVVMSSGDIKFNTPESLTAFISSRPGEEITFTVKNITSKETREVTAIPELKNGKGFLGIGMQQVLEVNYNTTTQRIFSGITHSISTLDYSLRVLGGLISSAFSQGTIKPLANTMVGPVGMFAITGAIIDQGIWQILNFIAVISLGLALINILPIPAADGGKMLFVIYEAIFKKNAPEKFERNFNFVGFIVLIGLSIVIAVKDIYQFFIK